jgi:hypothetical protein
MTDKISHLAVLWKIQRLSIFMRNERNVNLVIDLLYHQLSKNEIKLKLILNLKASTSGVLYSTRNILPKEFRATNTLHQDILK